MKSKLFVIAILCLFLSGCAAPPRVEKSSPPPPAPAIFLPEGERLKGLTVGNMAPRKKVERLFSFSSRDEEIGMVLLAMSRQIPYDIVIDPDVSGKVTVDLRNATLKEVLDTLTSLVGAEYKVSGNIIRVSRPKMVTRAFNLNYIATTRKGTSTLRAVTGVSNYTGGTTGGDGGAGGEGRGGSSIETGPDTADLWKEIETGLKSMISKEVNVTVNAPPEHHKSGTPDSTISLNPSQNRGYRAWGSERLQRNLVINKLSNLILVTDYPANLNIIAAFLERVEGSVHRQVMIQAKIVEVTLSSQYKTGLDWSAISKMGSLQGTLSGGMSLAQSLSPGTGVFQIGVSSTNFTALLDAMARQGKINVLSSPKISTLNNQKAVIKVGRDEVFFQPEYNIERDELTGTTRSVLTGVTPQTVTVGVVLDVTPQIDADGTITMHIHPSVTDLVKVEEFLVKGEVYATAPVIDIRETDTRGQGRRRADHHHCRDDAGQKKGDRDQGPLSWQYSRSGCHFSSYGQGKGEDRTGNTLNSDGPGRERDNRHTRRCTQSSGKIALGNERGQR